MITTATEQPSTSVGGAALLRLLQLSSSLCPIGAFAFSQGLEQAVERGWLAYLGSLAVCILVI
jgi:urease accessory protein UreF